MTTTKVAAALAALTATTSPIDSSDGEPGRGVARVHVLAPADVPALAAVFAEHGYFLEMLTCQDRRADLERLRLVYTFNVFGPSDRHLVHADLQPGAAAVSITAIYRAADWLEREVFDMFGVQFEGHPNLTRLLLPDDADFHPLLKDFGRGEDV